MSHKTPEDDREKRAKRNEYQRRWRAKNREKVREQKKRWREKHPEKAKEASRRRNRRHYAKNSKTILAHRRTPEYREKRRKYDREYARKRYQDNPTEALEYHKNYWKNATPDQKQRRRLNQTQNSRDWREKNPGKPMEYYMTAKERWTQGIDCRNPEVWKTAEEKAKALIQKLGYKDLFDPDFAYFYFDVVARKNGNIAVFQVTTLRIRQIKRKHIELVNYLGWDYFIIHVKPTLDIAYISRINTASVPNTKVVNYHQKDGEEHPLR